MKKYRVSIFTFLVALFMLWPASNNNWGGNRWVDILESDAKGYYAYLPAFIIYKDINFGHFDEIEKEKYYLENIFYDYRLSHNNKILNKYFVGTSILQMPFFFVAHWIALNSDAWDADGFSQPYLVSINIAAIFYVVLGFWLLLRVLEPQYGSISIFVAVMSIFATNLYYYAVGEPGMSHAYSYFLVSCLIYLTFKFQSFPKFKYLVWAAIVFGFLILIRPVNGLVLFSLPFLLGKTEFMKVLKVIKKPAHALSLSSIVIALFSIQFIIYYFQTGHFFVYSYSEEGFNWANPEILNALFSFRKGAFVYTPILLLVFPALFSFWKTNKFRVWAFILFFSPVLYVLFSWWNWWYGGSFSQRVLIEYYPILIVFFSMWAHGIQSKTTKKLLVAFSVICLCWCQLQTYQYRYNIIHWENMDREKYIEVLFNMPE